MQQKELLTDESLGKKLITKGFWLYLFTYLIAPSGYLIKVMVTNSVSVEEVGIMYSIIGFIGLITSYNDLGLTESLQYFIPKFWIQKKYDYTKTIIFISLAVQLFTGVVIAISLWYGAGWLQEHYFQYDSAAQILRILCFYFLGINIFEVAQTIFISFQDTFHNKVTEFIRMRSIVGGTGYLFFTGHHSIYLYSMVRVGGLFFALLVAVALVYKNYRNIFIQGTFVYDREMIRTYRKYAFRVFLGMNAGTILGQINQQLIIYFLGPKDAGYYTAYQSLFGIRDIVIGPLIAFLFPLVTEITAKKQTGTLQTLQNFLYTYVGAFMCIIAALFFALGPEIALILFGEKFIFSGQLVALTAVFVIVLAYIQISFQILAGLGKIQQRVVIIAIAALINTVIAVFSIPLIGIYGAIISSAIARIVMMVRSTRLVHKQTPIVIDKNYIFVNAVIAMGIGYAVWKLKSHFIVLEDAYRVQNIIYISVIGIISLSILIAINYKKVLFLKHEIQKAVGRK